MMLQNKKNKTVSIINSNTAWFRFIENNNPIREPEHNFQYYIQIIQIILEKKCYISYLNYTQKEFMNLCFEVKKINYISYK